MEKANQTASDTAASAKAGIEKARATVGGETEKRTTSDPMRKEMAEEKKDERTREREAERKKQVAYYQSFAEKVAQQGRGTVFVTGGIQVIQEPDVGEG